MELVRGFRNSLCFRASLIGAVILLTACATGSKQGATPPPSFDSGALLSQAGLKSDDVIELKIAGFNDFHGALVAKHEGHGGGAGLAAWVAKFRELWGQRLLVLEAGDSMQGTLESNLEEGAPVIALYNTIGIDAATIGNHEFDYGPVGEDRKAPKDADRLGALKARLLEAKYPVVASNIFEAPKSKKEKSKLYPFANVTPFLIKSVEGVRVAIIGATTEDTPTTTLPDNVKQLRFPPIREVLKDQLAAIEAQGGADVKILLTHAGLKCDSPETAAQVQKRAVRAESDPQPECEPSGEIVRTLKELPPRTFDLVVSGHSHQIVHHWINGTPVIQSKANGQFIQVAHLTIRKTDKKAVPELTRLEGPFPLCLRFKDVSGAECAGPNSKSSAPATYLGHAVEAPKSALDVISQTLERTAPLRKRNIGFAVRAISHARSGESELGNLVADAIRLNADAQVGLMNSGGIRDTLDRGPITYEHLYRVLPFDNTVATLKLYGRELKRVLKIGASGAHGLVQVSGLRMKVLGPASPEAKFEDANRDGVNDTWEADRLLSVEIERGPGEFRSVRDDEILTIAAPDFLAKGGDHWSEALKGVPAWRIKLDGSTLLRDALETRLMEMGPVNTLDQPLLRADSPRIEVH